MACIYEYANYGAWSIVNYFQCVASANPNSTRCSKAVTFTFLKLPIVKDVIVVAQINSHKFVSS